MRKSMLRLTTQVAGISAWLLVALVPALAQSTDTVLSGRVSSDREGAMEGVVVSARQTGSTMTVSVVSDTEGKYRFPASRLQPGHYDLTTRAAAYILDAGGSVDVAEGKTAVADLKLKPATELADQLTNAEGMASPPGEESIKRLLLNCTDCHGVQRIFQSGHTAADFLKVFERMGGYYPGASDLQPQRLFGVHPRPPGAARARTKISADLL